MASKLDVTLVTGTSADSVRGLVDALASEQVAVLQTGEPRLVRWGEGCGCCTVREDVVEQLRGVARDPGVKRALLVLPIEDSLEPVVKSFTVADEQGRILGDQATLQDLVTVVGADSLSGAVVPRALYETLELSSDVITLAPEGTSPDVVQSVSDTVQALNPEARHHVATDAQGVEPGQLGGGSPFDLSAARRRSGQGELTTPRVARVEFSEQRPFHPVRLRLLLDQKWPGVVRVQGVFWVASQPGYAALMDVAGADKLTRLASHWWAAVPAHQWPSDAGFRQYQATWHSAFGDRRQDLLVAGEREGVDWLAKALDRCLMTFDELQDPDAVRNLPHPFPWPQDS